MLRSAMLAMAGANIKRRIDELRRSVMFYMLAAVAFILGLLFLLLAAFVFFAERYGVLSAALGFAAVFVVLALLILAIHSMGGGRGARRRAEEERADQMRALMTAAAIGAAPAIIRSTGLLGAVALPIAAAIGYAIYRENRAPAPPPPPGGRI